MARTPSRLPPAREVELFDRLLAAAAAAIERKGATNPYTSLNGHMFSHLAMDGTLALRLPREARDDFLRTYSADLMMGPHGKHLQEYVAVPPSLFADPAALVPWMERSGAHVASLKPKPTKR